MVVGEVSPKGEALANTRIDREGARAGVVQYSTMEPLRRALREVRQLATCGAQPYQSALLVAFFPFLLPLDCDGLSRGSSEAGGL